MWSAAIRGGVGVVDSVDDDVVEALGGDASEVLGAGEFLDRSDHHGSVGLHEVACAPAHLCGLARCHEEAPEGALGLGKELLSVGEEEDARPLACAGCIAGNVEGGEPGLAEADGEDDEGASASLLACLREGVSGFPNPRKSGAGKWLSGAFFGAGASPFGAGGGFRGGAFLGLLESIAGAGDVDDLGAVKKPVDEGDGARGVREDLGPLGERLVGGQDDGARAIVAPGDDFEEQVGVAIVVREVTHLVDAEQARLDVAPEASSEGRR
jgi:hypothetical protein